MKQNLSLVFCPLQCPVLMLSFTLFSVLKAEIYMLPEVCGQVGQEEVILPCRFIPGQNNGTVTQAQWDLQAPGVNKTVLVVHKDDTPTYIDSLYKDKLELKEYSLVIKNVDIADAGVYACTLSTFPSGSLSGTTTLVINKQMPLSAGVVSAIVISVALLLGIIAVTLYFIVIRRCPPSSRNHILIDTQNAARDPCRPSFLKREDVVYGEVELQPSSHSRVSSSDNQTTYSEVNVNRTRRADVRSSYENLAMTKRSMIVDAEIEYTRDSFLSDGSPQQIF